MSGNLGLALIVVGGLTVLLSGVGGNVILMRRFGAITAQQGKEGESSALKLLSQLLVLAGIGALGLGFLVVGAVVRYRASEWALLVPAGMLAASLGAAWLVQRRRKKATQQH